MDSGPGAVNPHYLEHVMALGSERMVEASEDIYASNGVKLLNKGARIEERVRDRLLGCKLRKRLEDCMVVVQSVSSQQLVEVAESVLDSHSMLKALYWERSGQSPLQILQKLASNDQMGSLLTVYAQHRERKLEHAVAVSLLAMGLHHRVDPGNGEGIKTAMVAGLYHDVGELYINPQFFERGVQLDLEQWKHIAAHPVVAQRLLSDTPGIAPSVAKAVLEHHERLDGFGYPLGAQGGKISLEGQVVGAAEILVGLLESGRTPLEKAEVAVKLIPGEFSRQIIDAITTVCRDSQAGELAAAEVPALDQTSRNLEHVARVLHSVRECRERCESGQIQASAAAKSLLAQIIERFNRIDRAFSSTGLDVHDHADGLSRLAVVKDAQLHLEVSLILGETRWRLRELARELKIRVARLSGSDAPIFAPILAALQIA